jgi:ABC-type transport system involved in cytochrome c biogenesis permease component|tara:strand:- start:221 stop:445 length:225 start_codon:yes stop_codon:yes gene_type:complete
VHRFPQQNNLQHIWMNPLQTTLPETSCLGVAVVVVPVVVPVVVVPAAAAVKAVDRTQTPELEPFSQKGNEEAVR